MRREEKIRKGKVEGMKNLEIIRIRGKRNGKRMEANEE